MKLNYKGYIIEETRKGLYRISKDKIVLDWKETIEEGKKAVDEVEDRVERFDENINWE